MARRSHAKVVVERQEALRIPKSSVSPAAANLAVLTRAKGRSVRQDSITTAASAWFVSRTDACPRRQTIFPQEEGRLGVMDVKPCQNQLPV
ncbi:MAG: hypothetical protein LBK73_10320 [Treponema sp.]|nr:hypothetical protein [Treponema sp.]